MAYAARLNDPIGHSPTMGWLVGGLIAAVVVAATAVAVVGTGGLAAAAIIGGAAAAGGGIGEVLSTMSWAPKEEVGNITATGSPNVFTNGLRAIRAHLDTAKCDKHTDTEKIATGSGKVFINSMPAARVDDKTTCSATITKGSHNVNIGGETVQTDEMHAEDLVPTWVHVAMFVVGAGAAFVLAAPVVAIGGLVGGLAGGFGGAWAGGKAFGEGSDGQKWSMLGGSLLGGFLGAKGANAWIAPRFEPTVVPLEPTVVPPEPSGASSALARVGLREDLAAEAGIPRNIGEKPANVWGASLEDLKQSFKMDGEEVADKPARASSSGNAQIFTVKDNPYGIREVQFSPESDVSSHGAQYYKITYADGSKVKIIDPNSNYKLSFDNKGQPIYDKNTSYLNPEGKEIIFDPKTNKWVPK